MAAVKFEHNDIVDILLQNSADVNAKDHNDDTALMLAANSGQTEIVELLLQNNAEVNSRNYLLMRLIPMKVEFGQH